MVISWKYDILYGLLRNQSVVNFGLAQTGYFHDKRGVMFPSQQQTISIDQILIHFIIYVDHDACNI